MVVEASTCRYLRDGTGLSGRGRHQNASRGIHFKHLRMALLAERPCQPLEKYHHPTAHQPHGPILEDVRVLTARLPTDGNGPDTTIAPRDRTGHRRNGVGVPSWPDGEGGRRREVVLVTEEAIVSSRCRHSAAPAWERHVSPNRGTSSRMLGGCYPSRAIAITCSTAPSMPGALASLQRTSRLEPNRCSSRRAIVLQGTPADSARSFCVRGVRQVVQIDQLPCASRQAISLWSGARS